MVALRAFVERYTRLAPVPLVPEVSIFSASALSPLWVDSQSLLGAIDAGPPFCAFPWAGGQALARHVLDHPELVLGKVVLDFASGSGLCAIAAKRAGAARVVATDIDPLAAEAIRLNAEHAGLDVEIALGDLVAGALDEVAPEVVLAGDTFYEKEPAQRFDRWLRSLAEQGMRVLVGDPGRAYLPRGFLPVATYDVPVLFEVESQEQRRVVIYEITSPAAGFPP